MFQKRFKFKMSWWNNYISHNFIHFSGSKNSCYVKGAPDLLTFFTSNRYEHLRESDGIAGLRWPAPWDVTIFCSRRPLKGWIQEWWGLEEKRNDETLPICINHKERVTVTSLFSFVWLSVILHRHRTVNHRSRTVIPKILRKSRMLLKKMAV